MVKVLNAILKLRIIEKQLNTMQRQDYLQMLLNAMKDFKIGKDC